MKIEQNGSESAELSQDGSFVIVKVPVRVVAQAQEQQAAYRYHIGSFLGRETRLLVRPGAVATLAFRIPKELFRPRERLSLTVSTTGDDASEKILWAKRYELNWVGTVPRMEPIADYLGEPPEQSA